MRIPLTRELEEGGEWPRIWGWPWGLAWRDHSSFHAIVMPVPFNLIVGALRRLWYRILRGIDWDRLEKAEAAHRYIESQRDQLLEQVRELRAWKRNRLEEDDLAAVSVRSMIERIHTGDES